MSGGSMDYVYLHIKEAAEITEDKTISQLLTDIAKVLHDEEWADCCDITDAEYQNTLLKFKRKWLKQEPCEDCISRKAVLDALNKLDWQELYLPVHFKDMIDDLPSVQQKTGHCKDCKWWKDSDGAFRRGIGAESQCPINRREVFKGNGYCFLFEPQESEDKE